MQYEKNDNTLNGISVHIFAIEQCIASFWLFNFGPRGLSQPVCKP